jgi:hypothetical protein
MVINSRWNETNRLDNLSSILVAHGTSYYQIVQTRKDLHPVCASFIDPIENMKKDAELASAVGNRTKLAQEARELERTIGNLKGAYDTSLLETMAKPKAGQPDVSAITVDIHQKIAALNALSAQIAALDQKIGEHAEVRVLWERLQGLQDKDREALKADLRRLNFWFPLKKLGMQLVFLLPLCAVFYAWNGASIRRGRSVQTLVSSHLLVVAFIPVFFKCIELILDIIPKKLLRRIIDVLESFRLIAIWHYLVIALAVVAALFIIYLFQKKLFSREKLLERRIQKNQCQACGKQLPPAAQACPFCGFVQWKSCGQCNTPTPVYGKYCTKCGRPLS